MNAEQYAKFHERAGYRVLKTASSYWYGASRFVYMSIPPHLPIEPTPDELKSLYSGRAILGLRYRSATQRGTAGAMYTVRDKEYGLHSLHIKQRPYVRRGLDRCGVEEIDFELLEEQGLALNLDTLNRHGRRNAHFHDPKLWRRLCRAGAETPGAGVWGSFVEGTLAAYMIYFITDDTCNLLHECSHRRFSKQYPNHALQYTCIKEMISRSGVECVSGGFVSVRGLEGLDRYKRYAGYQKEQVHHVVDLRPLPKRLLLSGAFTKVVEAAHRFSRTRDLAIVTKAILDNARQS